MNGIALDVGINTGVVFAKLSSKGIPDLVKANTYNLSRLNTEALSYRLNDAVRSFQPNIIIVEYPLEDSKSAMATQTINAKRWWQIWVMRISRTSGINIPIMEIRPVDWKQTPAAKRDIFKNQQENWERYRPTKHEQDAAHILYWYSMYKYGQGISETT